MTKKFMAITASVVLLFGVLSGCGGTTDSGSTTGSTASAASTGSADATAAPQKAVALSYVSWMTKGEDLPVLDDFTKANPNIKVENQSLDGGQYDQLLKTRIMAGNTPDVFQAFPTQVSMLVQQGYVADVTNIPGVDRQAKQPEITPLVSVDGKTYTYALSGSKGPMFTYYNKKYFAAKNLTVPKTPEEFDALLEKIKADKIDPLVIGIKDNWSIDYPVYGVQSLNFAKWPGNNGLEMDLKLAKGEIKMSERYKDSFSKMAEYAKKGYISKAGFTMGWEQACQYFVDGKAAIFVCGNWVPGSNPVKNADKSKFEIGCFGLPYPVAADGKKHSPAGINQCLMLSSTTKYPEEAKKLYSYWIAPETNMKYLERIGQNSLNVDVKVDPVFDDYFTDLKDPIWKLEFLQGQKLPAAATANVGIGYANIIAGSPVETELKKLDADFEKVRPTIDVNSIK